MEASRRARHHDPNSRWTANRPSPLLPNLTPTWNRREGIRPTPRALRSPFRGRRAGIASQPSLGTCVEEKGTRGRIDHQRRPAPTGSRITPSRIASSSSEKPVNAVRYFSRIWLRRCRALSSRKPAETTSEITVLRFTCLDWAIFLAWSRESDGSVRVVRRLRAACFRGIDSV